MSATIEFFPADNGDMTLIRFESGRTLLIDCNIRGAADDPNDDTPDVGAFLRERLEPSRENGRLYVDTFLLSHPDQDHCSGLRNHFHLGPPGDWVKKDDKVTIREMWSAPIVFRRKDRIEALCEDAAEWRTEARRRVKLFREGKGDAAGNRILIIGEDIDGKTEGLDDILVRPGDVIKTINGKTDGTFTATVLGPLPSHDDEEEEATLAKNRSSVILRVKIAADGKEDACLFLTAGDAEVTIWERLWNLHSANPKPLQYNLLLTPHHCSWHSLSNDSWSEMGEDAEVSEDARSALSQTHNTATIISSSKKISDDDSDPPCVRAKREYEAIVAEVSGTFHCVADHVEATDEEVLLVSITGDGVAIGAGGSNTASKLGATGVLRKTEKKDGGRYAGRFA